MTHPRVPAPKRPGSEWARVDLLRRAYAPAAEGAPSVLLGIGDDAAVLACPVAGASLVWTVDEQIDGTHFRRDLLALGDVGYRAFTAAASDVAAMGARPYAALSALALPFGLTDDELAELAEGTRAAAADAGAPVVGGNLARGPVLAVTTTVLGTAARVVGRGGAQPGDGVYVAGAIGLAGAGFRALERNVQDARVDAAVCAWRRPTARYADGLAMSTHASAAVDVSDGLAQDAGHVAEASGVVVVLDAEALLAHAGDRLAHAAEALAIDALEAILFGGEDYALVATSATPLVGFTRVGDVREVRDARRGAGLILRRSAGETLLVARGFDHFAGG